LHDRYAAETRSSDRTSDNRARDSAVLAQWLEQFAGAAGGALFNLQIANATPALTRIRTELSSYYLLGVEPADEDRDGRTHEVAVKIKQPHVTIRGRRWVMIPKRGISARSEPSPAPAAAAAPSTPAAVPAAPPRRAVPADVRTLADVFDRGNRDAFQNAVAESSDMSSVIRGFGLSDSPWPANRHRTAAFALELALAGMRSPLRDVRDEGARLLAEYHVRVREPNGADDFECWWLVAEAAALESLFKPDSALVFIPRSLQRCPNNARLHLAHAFISEQQWLAGKTTPAQDAEVLSRYEQAMKFPETETEARVRAARFLHAAGQSERGLAVLNGIKAPAADREMRYFAHLIRGRLLAAGGRVDDAAAAFRAALTEWPDAQSAQVALMTMLVTRGRRDDAAQLADAVQKAPADQYDPWWMYWLGDYRVYPEMLAKLRELER
jgi:hypothetical protein